MLYGMKMRIAIDFRIDNGQNPGIQTFGLMLRDAFELISDCNVEFIWLVNENHNWFTDSLINQHKFIACSTRHLYECAGDIEILKPNEMSGEPDYQAHLSLDARLPREPKNFQEMNFDLVIFCSQDAFLTNTPSIYHPHDLQHEFLPNFFDLDVLGWRNLAWRTYAKMARQVVVASPEVAKQVNYFWRIPTELIKIIPTVPARFDWKDANSIRYKKGNFLNKGKKKFILYPAFYYEHKNHVVLLQALSILRQKGFDLELYLTGGIPNSSRFVEEEIKRLGLEESVKQFGYLSRENLGYLFSQAEFIVFPSLYEAKAFPVDEAIALNCLFLASDIESIRNQINVPEILFDPHDSSDLAKKMRWMLSLSLREKASLKDRISFCKRKDDIQDVARLYLEIIRQTLV